MKYLISLLFLFILFPLTVQAADCPFSRVNDSFPGQCVLYTDQNKDNFCDNSQNFAEDDIKNNNDNIIQANQANNKNMNYYIWQIITFFLIFQLLGIFLMQYNKLKQRHWRKINNYGMLISFCFVFITSLFILLNASGTIQSNNLRSIIWLHTESGLVMILFSIEHIIRHWRYFLRT